MRFSVVILLALLSAAAAALALQSSFGSADDPPPGQNAVEQCPTPSDGKPPQQAILRPAESEAEEKIGRQIAQLVLEAQEEGRALDEEQLRPLFELLMPDRVVILGADEPTGVPRTGSC